MPKIYRVSCKDQPSFFTASQAGTASHRKFLVSVKKIPRAEIQTTEIEYQASKAGVIELLNKLERGEV